MTIKNRNKNKNVVYKKIYALWYHMIDRCYNRKHERYSNYGGRGVIVCDKWKTFDGFLEDIDLIEGFDLDKIINGELLLDKDSIDLNNKIYCLNKCKFISKQNNNKYKPSQQKVIIATTPFGEEIEFFNQSEFAKDNNLRQSTISDCLRGRCKTHKGWKFKYKY